MFDIIEKDGNYYAILNEEEYNKMCIEDSKKEGIEKGIEKGQEKSKQDIARKLKNKKYSIKDIVEITGLTKEQIKTL